MVGDQVVLRTGGVLTATGVHTQAFVLDGETHSATVSWGKGLIRSFPYHLKIDDETVLESQVFIENWWLALWPWCLLAVFFLA
jgi:hypothetical protein